MSSAFISENKGLPSITFLIISLHRSFPECVKYVYATQNVGSTKIDDFI